VKQQTALRVVQDSDVTEIAVLYEASTTSFADAILARLECGKRLEEKKKAVGHGNWLPWLDQNRHTLGFGQTAAKRMMKAYDANRRLAADLTAADAIKLSRFMWQHDKPKKTPQAKHVHAVDDDWEIDPDSPGDDEQTIWRRGLMNRSLDATANAQYENWSRFAVDDELISTVEEAASAWADLAKYIRGLHHGNIRRRK
jgi:hypothetical protein